VNRLEEKKILVLTNILKQLKRIADALDKDSSESETEKDKNTLLNFYDANTK
jgi:hypothetical protein